MLKPTQPTNVNNLVPAGTHIARLYSIVDMGRQETEWNGEKKLSHKVRFSWELPNEVKTFDGESKPMVIGNQYTLSMGSKSNLRPVIEALIGVQLRDDEASRFDMEEFRKLLGTPCMLSVVHSTKGEKTYANISGIVPLPKGMVCPSQFNENQIFEIGTSDIKELEFLPKFMVDMIMKSEEMKERQTGYDNSQTIKAPISQEAKDYQQTRDNRNFTPSKPFTSKEKEILDTHRNAHNARNEEYTGGDMATDAYNRENEDNISAEEIPF